MRDKRGESSVITGKDWGTQLQAKEGQQPPEARIGEGQKLPKSFWRYTAYTLILNH